MIRPSFIFLRLNLQTGGNRVRMICCFDYFHQVKRDDVIF